MYFLHRIRTFRRGLWTNDLGLALGEKRQKYCNFVAPTSTCVVQLGSAKDFACMSGFPGFFTVPHNHDGAKSHKTVSQL